MREIEGVLALEELEDLLPDAPSAAPVVPSRAKGSTAGSSGSKKGASGSPGEGGPLHVCTGLMSRMFWRALSVRRNISIVRYTFPRLIQTVATSRVGSQHDIRPFLVFFSDNRYDSCCIGDYHNIDMLLSYCTMP